MNNLIKILLGLVVLAAVVILGMRFWPEQVKREEVRVGENLEGEADPSRMTLGMTEWKWIRTLYNDGRKVEPKKAGAFTLTFGNDGRFTAKTDCNSMGGTYVASADTITFSNVFMTKMYCEGSQESEFAGFLSNASGYHFTSRGEMILDLKFDSGTVIFR